jgi:uncharacterized sulfatase
LCAAPVTGTDLFFTLAAAAGLDVSAVPRDGLDLAPLLRAPATAALARDALHWHFPHYSRQGSEPAAAIRAGPLKLVEYFAGRRVELFDLAADPGEARDLAPARPTEAARLRESLHAWRTALAAREPTPNPHHDPVRPRAADYWGTEWRLPPPAKK